MAVATAPVADEVQVQPEQIVEPPAPSPRWGPPIWPAEQPIAALANPPIGQVDIITMSMLLAYRPE